MYKYASVIVSISMLFSTQLQAATEFLRFEGTIGRLYSETDYGYDPSLGIDPGQSVYFDFQIDTNLDVEARPDFFLRIISL